MVGLRQIHKTDGIFLLYQFLWKETIKRNYVFSACKKNRGSEKQRYPEPLPSSFLDIGESLSAYLQADINVLRIKKNVNVFDFFYKIITGLDKKR